MNQNFKSFPDDLVIFCCSAKRDVWHFLKGCLNVASEIVPHKTFTSSLHRLVHLGLWLFAHVILKLHTGHLENTGSPSYVPFPSVIWWNLSTSKKSAVHITTYHISSSGGYKIWNFNIHFKAHMFITGENNVSFFSLKSVYSFFSKHLPQKPDSPVLRHSLQY